jgi:hypothetical protein
MSAAAAPGGRPGIVAPDFAQDIFAEARHDQAPGSPFVTRHAGFFLSDR